LYGNLAPNEQELRECTHKPPPDANGKTKEYAENTQKRPFFLNLGLLFPALSAYSALKSLASFAINESY
jgi:hypothetical protein